MTIKKLDDPVGFISIRWRVGYHHYCGTILIEFGEQIHNFFPIHHWLVPLLTDARGQDGRDIRIRSPRRTHLAGFGGLGPGESALARVSPLTQP